MHAKEAATSARQRPTEGRGSTPYEQVCWSIGKGATSGTQYKGHAMTTNRTSELMSSIYEDLRRGVSSWEVWKEINDQLSLHPTGHFEFFDSVQIALLDSVLLAISRVLDDNPKTMSIPNLMRTESALRNSKLKGDVEKLLLNYKTTSQKIAQRRNEYIAHRQRKSRRSPQGQLLAVEIDKFLTSIVVID